MKQMKRNFSKLFTLGLVTSLFYACEKEFSEIGSGIVGDPKYRNKTANITQRKNLQQTHCTVSVQWPCQKTY
jgi:hypothetical protein